MIRLSFAVGIVGDVDLGPQYSFSFGCIPGGEGFSIGTLVCANFPTGHERTALEGGSFPILKRVCLSEKQPSVCSSAEAFFRASTSSAWLFASGRLFSKLQTFQVDVGEAVRGFLLESAALWTDFLPLSWTPVVDQWSQCGTLSFIHHGGRDFQSPGWSQAGDYHRWGAFWEGVFGACCFGTCAFLRSVKYSTQPTREWDHFTRTLVWLWHSSLTFSTLKISFLGSLNRLWDQYWSTVAVNARSRGSRAVGSIFKTLVHKCDQSPPHLCRSFWMILNTVKNIDSVSIFPCSFHSPVLWQVLQGLSSS